MAASFPRLGFGTSVPDDSSVTEAVRRALDVGYRHVDTAQLYGTEAAVGEAITRSSVDREEVFLSTKIEPENLAYDDVLETAAASLGRLGVDVLDLLYVHWPTEAYDPESTLAAFDELVDRGAVRHVGASNCNPGQLEKMVDGLDAPLFAHQAECHPLLPQEKLLALADELDHRLIAHTPLAQAEILDHPVLLDVATAVDASPAQVCLAWHRQRGVHPIPRTTTPGHIRDNLESLEETLADDAIARIDGIQERRRLVDFDGAPWDLA